MGQRQMHGWRAGRCGKRNSAEQCFGYAASQLADLGVVIRASHAVVRPSAGHARLVVAPHVCGVVPHDRKFEGFVSFGVGVLLNL